MQERYLFRGRRTDNGEWVQGYYYCNPEDKHFIYIPYIRTYDTYEVDPSTVGQCTGLRDKNGTLIFNGDVVRCVSGESCQGFHEHDNTFKVDTADWQHMMELSECEEVFVVCTIHTTPELMEGKT